MCAFLRKIDHEKDIFLLKNNTKKFATVILAWVTRKQRKQKNRQIRLIFWEGGIFVKLAGGGNFSKFFYRYLHYTDPGKRRKRKTKGLENHEIPATI